MFMKAILHNKEDDLHFLLKCLIEEIEGGTILKQEKKESDTIKDDIKDLKKKLKSSKDKEEKEKLRKEIELAESRLEFALADEKKEKDQEEDTKTAEKTQEEYNNHLENTLGEKIADKNERSKAIRAHNKMYDGFLNYVVGRFTDKEVIERYEGRKDESGETITGRIQQLQDEIEGKGQGTRKEPLTDAQKENYRRQIEGMKQEVANAKKNIADKKQREEKALKDIKDGKDLVIELEGYTATFSNASVKRAIAEREKSRKRAIESKLKAIEQKETFKQKAKELESIKGDSELFEVYMGQLEPKKDKFPFNLSPDLFQSTKKPKKTSSSKIFPLSTEGGARRKKATYLQGLELSAENPIKKLKELLGEKTVQDALSGTFEVGEKGILDTFTQLRGDGKAKSPRVEIEAYDRVLGLIEVELKKLNKLEIKPTTKSKLKKIQKQIKDLKTIYNTFNAKRQDKKKTKSGIETLRGTKSYYKKLKEALKKFEASVKTNRDNPEKIAIVAKRIFDSPELGDYNTVFSAIGILKGKEVRADKLQEALKRKSKLQEEIKNMKQGGRTTTRRNKLVNEFERTIEEIAELEKYKRIKAGKLAEEMIREPLPKRALEPVKRKTKVAEKKPDKRTPYEKFVSAIEFGAKAAKESAIKNNPKFVERYLKENPDRKEYINELKKSDSISKQEQFDAFTRYDITDKNKINVRDVPFDEDSQDFAEIKELQKEILGILEKTIGDNKIEDLIGIAFDKDQPDLSKEGREKRKKLKEKLASKRRQIRAKREGKEQIKTTLPANLIKQLSEIEEEISDDVYNFMKTFFPNFEISLTLKQIPILGFKRYTRESIEDRKKAIKENDKRRNAGEKLIPLPPLKQEDALKLIDERKVLIESKNGVPKKTKENYIKSNFVDYFSLFPTLVDKTDEKKPNSENVRDLWGNLIGDLMELGKLNINKKEAKEISTYIKDTEKRLEEMFNVFKGEKRDIKIFFDAIMEFADKYEKLANEYNKIIEEIKAKRKKESVPRSRKSRAYKDFWKKWLKENEGKQLPLEFMGNEIKIDKAKKEEATTKPKEKTPIELFIQRMSRTLEIIRSYYSKARFIDSEGNPDMDRRPSKEDIDKLKDDIDSTIKETSTFSESKRIEQYSRKYGKKISRYGKDEKEVFLTKEERNDIQDGLIHLMKTIGLPTQSEKPLNILIDLEQAYENALSRLAIEKAKEVVEPIIQTKKQLQEWFDNFIKETEKKEDEFEARERKLGDKDFTLEEKELQEKAKQLEKELAELLKKFEIDTAKSRTVNIKNLGIKDYAKNPKELRRILLTTMVNKDKLDAVKDLENDMKLFMGLDEKLKQQMNFNKALSLLEEQVIQQEFFSEADRMEAELLEEIREERGKEK